MEVIYSLEVLVCSQLARERLQFLWKWTQGWHWKFIMLLLLLFLHHDLTGIQFHQFLPQHRHFPLMLTLNADNLVLILSALHLILFAFGLPLTQWRWRWWVHCWLLHLRLKDLQLCFKLLDFTLLKFKELDHLLIFLRRGLEFLVGECFVHVELFFLLIMYGV